MKTVSKALALLLYVDLVLSTVTITPDPNRQSPATFTAGENLSLQCSSTLNNPSYSWSTSLTDEDGDSIETDSATIMGTFLHGANTGTHTCTATSGGNDEEKSYVLTVEGVSIWYMYPLPGGILKNNTAISVYTMVNEIRCYSGDTTSSNDNTDIMSPPGSSSLVFTNSAAGRLVKSGSASISSVDNGIYSCVYNEEYQVSFGVYSRDREPDSDDGTPLSIQSVDYTIDELTMTVTCMSTGWPATQVTWIKDDDILTSNSTYSMSQTITDRTDSTYENVLNVMGSSQDDLLGTYECEVTCLRHNDQTIDTALGSVTVQSVGNVMVVITTLDYAEVGSTYELNCTVNKNGGSPTITWKKNSVTLVTNTTAGIQVGDPVDQGDTVSVTLILGPLHQSHDGQYSCTGQVNSAMGTATVGVDVGIPTLPVSITPDIEITATVGVSVTLECHTSLPESLNGNIASINWTHNGAEVTEGVTTMLAQGESSLDLDAVVSADAGTYTCNVQIQSEFVDVDSHLIATNTSNLTIQMPVPSEPIIAPQPIIRQYFSGVEIRFTCFFNIDNAISGDDNAVVTADWRKGDSLLTGDDRLSVTAPKLLSGETYFGSVDFDYLTLLDSDNYSCEAFVTSNLNSEFITDTSQSSSIMINVEGPTPEVNLTSSTLRLPAHPDYNQAILTCTATLPLPPEIDELEFDKVFTWTMSGTDVTSDATTPTDPDGIESISTLTRNFTIAGEIVFRCEVNISVPGDPVVSNSSSMTITVLGPSNPNKPTDMTAINILHNEATIQWTVSSITYTPEQYIVLYGIDESSLTQESDMVNGTMDFNSINDTYSVKITGLDYNTVYYYQVRSTNTEGSTNSDVVMFQTTKKPPTAPPENFIITAINSTALQLQWDLPPEEHRNGIIIRYTLSCEEMISDEYLLVTSPDFPLIVNENGSVSLVLNGFRPGTPINCTVSASNAAATGPSTTSSATTDEEPPAGPPLNFTILDMTSRTFTVTWSPPDPFLRYGVIISYSLTCEEIEGGHIPSSYPRMFTGPPIYNVTVDELRPFTDYRCSLIAINSAGNSDPTTDTSITDEDAPESYPREFSIEAIKLRSLTFTWKPVDKRLQNGPIINYTISCNSSSILPMEISPDDLIEDNNGVYNHTIFGFTPGTKYVCSIYANSSVGAGPEISAIGVTREESPESPPRDVVVTGRTSTSVMISWLSPELPNGVIILYKVYITYVDCPGSTSSTEFVNNGNSFVIMGLSPYQMVQVQVSALTSVGEGPRSDLVTGRSNESVPRSLEGISLIPESESVLLISIPSKYNLSIANGIIIRILISIDRYTGDDEKQTTIDVNNNFVGCVSPDEDGETYEIRFSGLAAEVPYNVSVIASTSVGEGVEYLSIIFTQEGLPPAPQNVTANRVDDSTMIVRWNRISIVDANGQILGYTINYRSNSRRRQTGSKTVGPDEDQAVIDDLQSGVRYSVDVTAATSIGTGSSSDVIVVDPPSGSPDDQGINPVVIVIPLIIILFIFIVIVAVIIAIVYIKRMQYSSTLHTPPSSTSNPQFHYTPEEKIEINETSHTHVPIEPSSNGQVENIPMQSLPMTLEERLKPIPRSAFSQHVKEMHRERDKNFELEYMSLTSPTVIASEIAKNPINRPKNRFANIFPYDFSRVVLEAEKDKEGSDYINASYIDGYNRENAYIAAQGPMTNTVQDFWRMVWEHGLDTIVMLTKCIEGGKRKCEQYWPEKVNETIETSSHISVTLVEIVPYADFEKKTFRVLKTTEDHISPIEVTHWHFLGWPDHGVPQYATSLISFIRHVRKNHSKHGPPILTHCSAGVGRTGTFILLDSMLERLTVEDTINVYEFLRRMRTKRVFMVQTLPQYVFIHDALDELITCGETDINVRSLKNKIDQLHKVIPGKGTTGFDSQYQLLDQVCRKPTDIDCSDALEKHSSQKNRYPDRVPYNVSRARLRPSGVPGSDYINASFIDGYKLKNAYIATQGPLISTTHDFWRLIWEFKSKAIVQLCCLEENDVEVCYQYWPAQIGEPMYFNHLIVTLQSETKKLGYTVRKLEIKEDKPLPNSFVVTQFHYTDWTEHSCPNNPAGILTMLEDLNKVQRNTGNKTITVMCNDGMGRSGTFICLHAQQDRLKTEGVIDIFHYIKSTRIQRARLVSNLEQYIYCHQTLLTYYGRFESYSNFQ